MKPGRSVSLAVVLAAAVISGGGAGAAQRITPATSIAAAPTDEMAPDTARATVDKYCVGCHNARTKAGDLVLADLAMDRLAPNAEIWEKAVRKLRIGAMPPQGNPRPDDTVRASLVSMLEHRLDREAAAAPDPGHHVVHRLNRTEYTNAVRELLAVSIDNQDLLPPDDSGYGFDNVADVLSMSPGLLERYLLAARKIARVAVGDATMRPAVETYRLPYLTLLQDERMSDDLPVGTRGGLVVRHQFPLDGEYVIKLRLQRHAQALGNRVRGLAERSQIEVRIDGTLVKTFFVGGTKQAPGYAAPGQAQPDADLEVRLPVSAGVRTVGVAFVNTNDVIEGGGPSRIPASSDGYASVTDSSVAVGKIKTAIDSIDLAGPFNGQTANDSPSRRKIFVCTPVAEKDEQACAQRIFSTLARRAYRRPVTGADVKVLMDVYKRGRADGTFDTGIQWGLERLLTDPDFLLRVEHDPAGVKPGTPYRLDDVALASRLSFFLWSSIPDDELLELAARGRLKDEAVLLQQVQRMLHDERASSLITNFFSQWLTLRALATQRPDVKAFPDFDENLRRAFQQETELFLRAQFLEDRPATELLTANYTFVNERLARHYGIPYVRGAHFRRVTYPDDRRAGLLGQGSILTVTSYAHRTSPVLRGAWILRNLLGVPPPPPPANVPPFPENTGTAQPKTVRERMEQHRRNPVCAACHGQMDPLGFAFENFDAIGRWRTIDEGSPIDPSGAFPGGGVKFGGPTEFRAGLMNFRELYLSTMTTKLLTYALGRGVDYRDMPAVRQILREAEKNDVRWSSLIVAVVKSMPFQMRRAES
jgi:mono/diheme cytochrome c family protein